MKYEINNIYNVNCFDAMKNIPDSSIDCIYTDPPYLFTTGGKGKSILGERAIKIREEINFISNGFDIKAFINECFRVLKTVNIFIWCSNNQVYELLHEFYQRGYNPKILVWCKTNPTPLSAGHFLSDVEYCIAVQENGKSINMDVSLKSKFDITSTNKKDKLLYLHPTIKPEDIVKKHLLNTTQVNDIILDPFLGSGTTCAVAKEIKRQYLGFELDEKWYKIAKDRIDGIQLFKGEKQTTIFDMED